MRDFLISVNQSDMVESGDIGREAAVDAEHLLVDERGHCEVVEHPAAVPPRVGVPVLVLAFV